MYSCNVGDKVFLSAACFDWCSHSISMEAFTPARCKTAEINQIDLTPEFVFFILKVNDLKENCIVLFQLCAQKDELKLEELIETTLTVSQVSIDPNFDYLWHWQVQYVEEGMVFQDEGNSSLTLQYLTFCSDTELDRGYMRSGDYFSINYDTDSYGDVANSGVDMDTSGGSRNGSFATSSPTIIDDGEAFDSSGDTDTNGGNGNGSYTTSSPTIIDDGEAFDSSGDTDTNGGNGNGSYTTSSPTIIDDGETFNSGGATDTNGGNGNGSYTASSPTLPINDGDTLPHVVNSGDHPVVSENVTGERVSH